MKDFRWGTPGFGIFLGGLLTVAGVLIMTLGFWKTVLLAILFILGYFLGAVDDKTALIKQTINRVVPEKKNEVINFREELAKEQEAARRGEEDRALNQVEKEDEE